MSYLVKQAEKSHQVRRCMGFLLADVFNLETPILKNVFIYQENYILNSQVDNLLLVCLNVQTAF